MANVVLSVVSTGPGVTVRTLRAKNLATGEVQGVALSVEGKGAFQALEGVPYLLTRYVIGPAGAEYKLTLAVKRPLPPPKYAIKVRKGDAWDGENPLKAAVWPSGFGLHNSAIRVEVE